MAGYTFSTTLDKPKSLADFLGTEQPAPSSDALVERPEMSVKDFCRGVLESLDYRRSVFQRVTLGSLPPAVELRMYDYAYGKPPDRIEVTEKVGDELTPEQIEARLEHTQYLLRLLKSQRDDDAAAGGAVH